MSRIRPYLVTAVLSLCIAQLTAQQYLGKFIGKLSELQHGVSGEVYAVDGRTLHVKDFTYDGQGPAAYFYAGNTRVPGNSGFRLRDENGSGAVIRRYRKEGITLTLPEGKSLNNIKIFYVWCEEFAVNFGDVKIPRNFDYPRPQKIDGLQGVHAISSDNIVIVDAQTLLIPNLSYDGEAPDAKFWVGRGSKPSPQGIRVPDENGKEVPLRRYDRKTIVLTLPGDLTVFDIGHFGIWCEAFTVDFGHVQIPQNLNIPPSLRMLGISPQSKLNCEVLYDDLAFEVRWAIAGDSIVVQLVAKLDAHEYMSFGLSGDDKKSVMINGDVVVAWVDKDTLKGYAEDYYLNAKSQCSGPTGSCPDNKFSEKTNNIRLLNAAMVNGYSIVTYQRPLQATDEFDRPILTNQSQAIIWAIGPLNQRNEVSFHSHYLKQDKLLNFGRIPKWNCPMPETEQPSMKPILQTTEIVEEPTTTVATSPPSRPRISERRRGGSHRTTTAATVADDNVQVSSRNKQGERKVVSRVRGGTRTSANVKEIPTPAPVAKRNAWEIPPIQCYEPEDGVFYAQMGPTGGKRGYPAITGHVGWGISWYINGLLIPEINVVRGKTYTFVVEGGFDSEVPAKYHPFYITDDPIGGYEYKTPEERKNIRIFAGVRQGKDGVIYPTGTGRLCHWTQQGELEADDFESFGAYQRTLELKCDQGEPGVIQWIPDKDTPDTVYYQCFTHRYLGWKINVLDSCDEQPSASEQKVVSIPAPDNQNSETDENQAESQVEDLEDSQSIRVETRVKLNDYNSDDKDLKTFSKLSDSSSDVTVTTNEQDLRQQDEQTYVPQQHLSDYKVPTSMINNIPFQAQDFYSQYNDYNKNIFRPSPTLDSDLTDLTEPIITTTERPKTTAPTTISTTTTSTSSTTTTVTKSLLSNTTNKPIFVRKPDSTLKFIRNKMPLKYHKPEMLQFITYRYPFSEWPRISMHPPPPPRKGSTDSKKPNNLLARPSNIVPNSIKFISNYPKTFPKMPMRPKKPSFMHSPVHFVQKKKKPLQVLPPNKTPVFTVHTPQLITKSPPISSPPKTAQNHFKEIKNVEISPIQPSTEKEPEIQTAKPSESFSGQYKIYQIRPALNTGFHPETVKIEGGFKPIISKEFQDRIDEDEFDSSQLGVIRLDSKYDRMQIESFEPMFVPSPTDKLVNKNKKNKLKHSEFLNDTLAEASKRVESYYLPPQSSSRLQKVPQKVSDVAPDVVVTYDGKKVSGASLTEKLSHYDAPNTRTAKVSEFIRNVPQYTPFKGELPPLNVDVNTNLPQLQPQSLAYKKTNLYKTFDRNNITRLTSVNSDFPSQIRLKRSPHHTPEHTHEQEQQRLQNITDTSSSNTLTLYVCYLFISSVVLRVL